MTSWPRISRRRLWTRAGDWVERLQAVGIDNGSYSFSIYEDRPSAHAVTQLDTRAARPGRSRIHPLAPSGKYGALTRDVLREMGYGDALIDALIDDGVVSQSWSRDYLPA